MMTTMDTGAWVYISSPCEPDISGELIITLVAKCEIRRLWLASSTLVSMFVSDYAGNHEDSFSHDTAQF